MELESLYSVQPQMYEALISTVSLVSVSSVASLIEFWVCTCVRGTFQNHNESHNVVHVFLIIQPNSSGFIIAET